MRNDLARPERWSVQFGVVDAEGNTPTGIWTGDQLDQLRPSPESVTLAKEAETLVYGRKRGRTDRHSSKASPR